MLVHYVRIIFFEHKLHSNLKRWKGTVFSACLAKLLIHLKKRFCLKQFPVIPQRRFLIHIKWLKKYTQIFTWPQRLCCDELVCFFNSTHNFSTYSKRIYRKFCWHLNGIQKRCVLFNLWFSNGSIMMSLQKKFHLCSSQ